MKFIDDKGRERVLNPGQCLCGEGITEITSLTWADLYGHPKNMEWFVEDVLTRFTPRGR